MNNENSQEKQCFRCKRRKLGNWFQLEWLESTQLYGMNSENAHFTEMKLKLLKSAECGELAWMSESSANYKNTRYSWVSAVFL